MTDLPGYDAWKLATPPEQEADRCDCGEWSLDEVPPTHRCFDPADHGELTYWRGAEDEDITW